MKYMLQLKGNVKDMIIREICTPDNEGYSPLLSMIRFPYIILWMIINEVFTCVIKHTIHDRETL